MINFHASSFTWESKPHEPDLHYKYRRGMVGKVGDAYHVRFNLQSACWIRRLEAAGDDVGTELFLGSPCRSEYTIAETNLFQIPSGEWRMPFGRRGEYSIATRPSWEPEPSKLSPYAWPNHRIAIRYFDGSDELTTSQQIVEASLADDLLNGHCTYRDEGRGLQVTVEFPVNLINLNVADPQFQVCTGPLLLPDLETWDEDGSDVARVFVADVALSRFDRAEFILRRDVEAAASEKQWLDQPRGRDRFELLDPANPPQGYPPARPRPTVFNEVWDLQSTNVLLRVDNSYSTKRL